MGVVNCKYEGTNIYEGKDVYVVYIDHTSMKWIIEKGTVVNGQVEIESAGPLTNQQYWIGLSYESVMKTLPIVNKNQLGKKSRISSVGMYVNNSHGGKLEIDGNEVELEYPSEELFTGKVSSRTGGKYSDEPQLQVSTDGVHDLRILALEFDYQRYER